MEHAIHRIVGFSIQGAHTLRVEFDDGVGQEVDLAPVLHGGHFGPLQDPAYFARAELDPEAHTIVWPNGADLDPETLHDWATHGPRLAELARRWSPADAHA
jgi:hypothetical protein